MAEPFITRNLNPLVAIFGLPAFRRTREELEVSLTSELANHYRLSNRAGQTLILDAETWRNTLAITKPLADSWSVTVELPHYQQYGGILDNVIDAWHSTFHLPDGGRNNRSEGEVIFEMANENGTFFEHTGDASGFGDALVSVARKIGQGEGFHVGVSLKLPTGDEAILAGSGSADFALTLFRPRAVQLGSRPAAYYWGVGFMALGEADRIAYRQKGDGYLAMIGGSLQLGSRFGIKAQLDAHTALYASPLEEIGEDAYQASLGGWWSFGERGLLDFAVVEDLEVSTSPDVVIQINLSWAFP